MDNVNHPAHYETGKYECIDVMQEVFGTEAVKHFCQCNAFKYVYRMNRKNGTEDAQKAIWYLNKYVELEKHTEEETLDIRTLGEAIQDGDNEQECVQPKMGRWIMPQMDDGMSDPVVYQVRCSVCKWDVDPQIWYEELAHAFCPNCGAKLGGGNG